MLGSAQPWRVVNEAQWQCDSCHQKQLDDEAVKSTAERLGEIQSRVLKIKPVVGESEKIELKDLAELEDADRQHRAAVARKFGFPTS